MQYPGSQQSLCKGINGGACLVGPFFESVPDAVTYVRCTVPDIFRRIRNAVRNVRHGILYRFCCTLAGFFHRFHNIIHSVLDGLCSILPGIFCRICDRIRRVFCRILYLFQRINYLLRRFFCVFPCFICRLGNGLLCLFCRILCIGGSLLRCTLRCLLDPL